MNRTPLAALLAFGLLIWGCGNDVEDAPQQDAPLEETFWDEAPPAASGKADEMAFTWEALDLQPPASLLQNETRRVLSTARAFEDFMGVPAPASVDFEEEWVVFFTPGAERSGVGADLEVIRYSDSLRSLQIVTKATELEGECGAATEVDALLATFPRPALRPQSVRYYHVDAVETCGADACAVDLQSELESATEDLWYLSESDYPFEVVHIEGITSVDEVNAPLLASIAGIEALEPFEQRSLEDFFAWIARPESGDMDAWEREETARYRALKALIEERLTNPHVFRLDTIEVQVFILGESECGEVVGLHTRSIET